MIRKVLSVGSLLALTTLFATPARAADNWSTPYPGVRYLVRDNSDPNRIHAVVIDLCATGVTTTATKPADRGMRTSSFAQQYGAQIAINGGFYSFGSFAPVGLIMGDGERWTDSADNSTAGFIAFGADNRVELSIPSDVLSDPEDWMQNIISGYPLIVDNGQVVNNACQSHWCYHEPRTAVGLDATGKKLILAVVDGRWSGVSRGMTTKQMGEVMASLGAERAINLDGGGSTTLYIAAEGGVVNHPSDGSERVVSNHLGILAGGGTDYAHCCSPQPASGANGTFGDVPDNSWYYDIAETMYAEGVTSGCQASPRMFCPNCDLDRRHAAILVARALGLTPVHPAQPTFTDVTANSPGYAEIEALYAHGYVNGCSQQPKKFCPDDWLQRSTAAVMIVNAMGVSPGPPTSPAFTDVPANAWYRNDAEFLHASCVVKGCSQNPVQYCPDDIITRVEFSAMLVHALKLGSFDNCMPAGTPASDVGTLRPDAGPPADTGSPVDTGVATDVGSPGDIGTVPDAAHGGDVGTSGDAGGPARTSSVTSEASACGCRSTGGRRPRGGWWLVVVGLVVWCRRRRGRTV